MYINGVSVVPIIACPRNSPDVDGNTPLMLAAAKGHSDVCELLLQQGARVELKRCPDNRTPGSPWRVEEVVV